MARYSASTQQDDDDWFTCSSEESSPTESKWIPTSRFWQNADDSSSSSDVEDSVPFLENHQSAVATSQDNQQVLMDRFENLRLETLSSKRVAWVNVNDYLQEIETAIRKREQQEGHFTMMVTQQDCKLMFRTLLGIHSKMDFQRKWRQAQSKLHFEDFVDFVSSELKPALVSCFKSETEKKAPNLVLGMERVLSSNSDDVFGGNVHACCSFLARGPAYRGDFEALLQDVTPHLVAVYNTKVKAALTQEQIMTAVLDLMDTSNKDDSIRRALDQCIHCQLPPAPMQQQPQETMENGKQRGLQCEEACMSFLKERYSTSKSSKNQDTWIVIQNNVFIKPNKTTNKRVRQEQFKKEDWPLAFQNNNDGQVVILESGRSNVIETTANLSHGTCEELDAIVYQVTNYPKRGLRVEILEVWEAKATASPTTIHDALVKKYSVIQSILDESEQSTCCWFNNASDTNCNTTSLTIHPESKWLFGLYSSQAQPVHKAVNQLRDITCHIVLSNDKQAVCDALACGQVKVECDAVLQRLLALKGNINQKLENLAVVVEEKRA